MGKLARKVAIVGAGMSKFGAHYPKKRNPDLWVDAWLDAVKKTDLFFIAIQKLCNLRLFFFRILHSS